MRSTRGVTIWLSRDEDRLAESTRDPRHLCHHWRQGRVPHDRTTDTIALDQIERILI
jgi:hypothetical protein